MNRCWTLFQYAAVEFGLDKEWKFDSNNIKSLDDYRYLSMLQTDKILQSKLSGGNIKVINTWAISIVRYTDTHQE